MRVRAGPGRPGDLTALIGRPSTPAAPCFGGGLLRVEHACPSARAVGGAGILGHRPEKREPGACQHRASPDRLSLAQGGRSDTHERTTCFNAPGGRYERFDRVTSARCPRRVGHRVNDPREHQARPAEALSAWLSAALALGTPHEPPAGERAGATAVGPSSGLRTIVGAPGTVERRRRKPGAVAQPTHEAALGSGASGHPHNHKSLDALAKGSRALPQANGSLSDRAREPLDPVASCATVNP